MKLVFLLLFFGLMSPVSTHAIARAALHAGVKPVLDGEADDKAGSEEASRIETLIPTVLLTLLAATSIGIVRLRNLFAVAVLSSVYSFLMASVLIALDAVDVAMTEASVGAGISTVLMLGTLYLTKTEEARPQHSVVLPLFVAGVTGGRADVGHQRAAAVRHRRLDDPGCRPGLHRPLAPRDRHTQRRHFGAGQLPWLRHARRNHGDLHRRHRRLPASQEVGAARQGREGVGAAMRLDVILRVTTKLILPFMLLFAAYVQFHGDYGPGGGFQAGVIAGASLILYALIYGLGAAMRVVPAAVVEALIPLGVLIYAGIGVYAMLNGGNFLDYSSIAHDPVHGQEWGVFVVELGVFITVAATMLAIFYAFAGRGRG